MRRKYGCTGTGIPFPNGVYFLRFEAGTVAKVEKIVLVR